MGELIELSFGNEYSISGFQCRTSKILDEFEETINHYIDQSRCDLEEYYNNNETEILNTIYNYISKGLEGYHYTANKIISIAVSVLLSSVFIEGENIEFCITIDEYNINERFSSHIFINHFGFSANVSHELKTPLTIIVGYAEMIQRHMVKGPDIPLFAEKITNETTRLMALIEDIIQISEMDEKAVHTTFSPCNMTELIKGVMKNLAPAADKKEITMTLTGENITICSSKDMLYEILYNLLDNSIKYNKEKRQVKISLTKEKQATKIQITDTGIGIGETDRERILERFYRVDESRSKKTGGTGLGLSIVKHMVEYLGGKLTIESELNIGTLITIIL